MFASGPGMQDRKSMRFRSASPSDCAFGSPAPENAASDVRNGSKSGCCLLSGCLGAHEDGGDNSRCLLLSGYLQ